MHLATLFGEQMMIELLLQHGAEVDATSEARSWTPLMIALNENHLELAQWLIWQGANPNHVDQREGWTPLLVACDMGLREFSQQLLERGARLDARVMGGDIRGRYAIHLASYTGEVELVRSLVEYGMDVNQQPDGGGLSALHWAVYNGHQDLLEYLLAQGANPNLRASGIYQMRTPLHYAVSCRQLLMAEQLLDHHASPLLRDTEGISPFALAYQAAQKKNARVYRDLVSLLEAYL
jgi:serine/threonine-protein phosphatase 6 regulatory ankyrin repeat subunit A